MFDLEVKNFLQESAIDQIDLKRNPNKYIEKGIRPFVYSLWKNGIETYESGQDILIPKSDYEDGEVITHDDNFLVRSYFSKIKQQYRDKAFIIINKRDLQKAKQFLPQNIEVETGTGGFMPSEYNPALTHKDHKNMVYVQWPMFK